MAQYINVEVFILVIVSAGTFGEVHIYCSFTLWPFDLENGVRGVEGLLVGKCPYIEMDPQMIIALRIFGDG